MRLALAADQELGGLFEDEVTLRLGPLGPTPRVDLLWAQGKIVVELDGAEHERDPTYAADRHRDYELLVAGYLVLRMTNDEVELDLARSLDKVRRVVNPAKRQAMSFEPTPFQALLLFGLLARHGACKQAELVPAIAAKDRDALAAAKLVAVKKIGRTFHLDLTDAGWGWAGAHLAAELPPAHRTLHDWLTRLSEHFARSGDTLAEFVGAKPEDAVEADARKALEEKRRAAEEKAERLARGKREKEEARAAKQQATKERKRLAAENAERIAREKEEKAKAKEAAKDA